MPSNIRTAWQSSKKDVTDCTIPQDAINGTNRSPSEKENNFLLEYITKTELNVGK